MLLSSKAVANIFPFHVLLDKDLIIQSVGKHLPKVLGLESRDDLVGKYVDSAFALVTPHHHHWTHKRLLSLEDESIAIQPVLPSTAITCRLILTGSVVVTSPKQGQCLLIVTPNDESLRQIGLAAPRYGLIAPHSNSTTTGSSSTADAENTGHTSGSSRPTTETYSPVSTTRSVRQKEHAIAKLTDQLHRERRLLESLLPQHAAEGLRRGQHVDPIYHERVSMFFSDIAGFTTMCDKIFPWEIIGVLNRLYCIMDHLAHKFGLFKIETIGDAYVCAAGLPVDDPRHAEKVATFALAVSHCARHVLSPVDGKPLQLRVGIHSGSCASGVVGVTNPRYCVFGDTVNITSRHESTGEADRVHASEAITKDLVAKCNDKFVLTERGKVDMKGKGQLTTYWLTASETHPHVNGEGLAALDAEVKQVLYDADFGSSKEKRSKAKMENFSPGKMQKVALSLDKLALDVLRRTSLLVEKQHKEKSHNSADQATKSVCRGSGNMQSLASMIDETTPVPATTDEVYGTLSSIFRSLSEMDKSEFQKSLTEMNSELFLKLCESDD